jgi:hypothetical protein
MAEKKKSKKRTQINQEIKDHGKTWCSKDCPTFLPDAYREARLSGDTMLIRFTHTIRSVGIDGIRK